VTAAQLNAASAATLITALGTSERGSFRDRRIPGTSGASINFGAPAAPVGTILEQHVSEIALVWYPFRTTGLVLVRNTGVAVFAETANSAVDVWFQWREREARPDERI
jgi:hypothetical protein